MQPSAQAPGKSSLARPGAKGLLALPPGLVSGAGGHAPRDGVSLGEGVVLPKDYVPAAESAHALYQVDLASFSGPLDLLLFLIKRHHLNVFDIPMAFVCARYLEALDWMQDYTLDCAAEFMFMASELLHIKSRMLLPQAEDEAEDGAEPGDPRAELVARLLAYQTFKEAADTLHGLPQHGRDTFERAPQAIEVGAAKLRELDSLALVAAFNRVLLRQRPEVRHQVIVEQVPMRLRMHRIIAMLAACEEGPLAFEQVLREVTARVDLIVSFLAILEMAKLKLLRVFAGGDDALFLQARFSGAQQALERLAGAQTLAPSAAVPVDDYAG